jgi:hypothetical protein
VAGQVKVRLGRRRPAGLDSEGKGELGYGRDRRVMAWLTLYVSTLTIS